MYTIRESNVHSSLARSITTKHKAQLKKKYNSLREKRGEIKEFKSSDITLKRVCNVGLNCLETHDHD